MTSKQKHGSKGACLTCLPECLTVFKMSQVSLNLQVWANQGWRRVWIVQTEMCVCVPGGVYMLRWQESSRRFQPPPIWEKNTWCHQREADWSQMFQPGSFHVFNEGEGMEETFSSLVSPQILFPCLRVPSGASEGGKKKEERKGLGLSPAGPPVFMQRSTRMGSKVGGEGWSGWEWRTRWSRCSDPERLVCFTGWCGWVWEERRLCGLNTFLTSIFNKFTTANINLTHLPADNKES